MRLTPSSAYRIPGFDRDRIVGNKMRVDEIIKGVCEVTGVPVENIYSYTRQHKNFSLQARFFCILLVRLKTDLTLVQMGQEFRRDHSTIIHDMYSITQWMDNNEELRQTFKRCYIRLEYLSNRRHKIIPGFELERVVG